MDLLKKIIALIAQTWRERKARKKYESELSRGLTRGLAVKIAEKHGLAGKIGFYFPDRGPTELVVLSEEGKSPDLPGRFLKDLFWGLCRSPNLKRKNFNGFRITTMEKRIFEEHIEAWNFHCELANSCD
jgi:hypothetical protein